MIGPDVRGHGLHAGSGDEGTSQTRRSGLLRSFSGTRLPGPDDSNQRQHRGPPVTSNVRVQHAYDAHTEAAFASIVAAMGAELSTRARSPTIQCASRISVPRRRPPSWLNRSSEAHSGRLGFTAAVNYPRSDRPSEQSLGRPVPEPTDTSSIAWASPTG